MAPQSIPPLARFALRALSRLAPFELRGRWLREWEGEFGFWQMNRRAHPSGARTGMFPRAGSYSEAAGLLFAAACDTWHLRSLRKPHGSIRTGGFPPKNRSRSVITSLLQDVRFSLRAIRSAPWLSFVTVGTLAVGIGVSVAMFGVLHQVFIRPLPFPDPDLLVVGRATFKENLNPWVAGADYYDYRDESEAFQELAAILPFAMERAVSRDGEAFRVSGNAASPNLFATLEVRPALGRTFRPEEGLAGAEDVVLLSHGFWMQRLGSDPGVLGSTLFLDGNPFTVVGVMPADFFFMVQADLWTPMRPDRDAASSRGNHNWYLVGRLRPEFDLDRAQAGVDVISARLQEAYPDTNRDKALRLTALHEVLTEDYKVSLWILSGAVALVLLIACGNAAGILLARAPARRFELSIRTAIGAPRGRLARQLLAESLGLALSGGALGTALAIWFQGVMLQYLRMEKMGLQEPDVSLPILGAALVVSLLAGLLAGVYPALRCAQVSLTDGLKTGFRGKGDSGSRFRSGLVVAQVALSVVLLAGSGLLIRSLSNLRQLDPGFEARGLLTAEVQLPAGRYPDASSRIGFFSALAEEVRALPGVDASAITSHLPIRDFGNIYQAYGEGSEEDRQRVFLRGVDEGYFGTLEIPVLSGRGIEAGDDADTPLVVVLSQTAAQRFFPGESALGKRIGMDFASGPRFMEVVGVSGDVRLSRLEEEAEAALYVPFRQRVRGTMRLAIRPRSASTILTGSLRQLLSRMDPAVPLSPVETLEELVAGSLAERRVITLSLTLLALLPLLLASVGLFAILAYHVSRRRHELGIRMALGARASQVSRLVLGHGLGLVSVGVSLGLFGAWGGTRLLQGLLFDVEATDPLTLLAVTGMVLSVSLAACAIPMWRAARSDPRTALQAE